MNSIAARVVVVEPTGAETELVVDVGGEQLIIVTHGRPEVLPEQELRLHVQAAKAHVFDAGSGQRLT